MCFFFFPHRQARYGRSRVFSGRTTDRGGGAESDSMPQRAQPSAPGLALIAAGNRFCNGCPPMLPTESTVQTVDKVAVGEVCK